MLTVDIALTRLLAEYGIAPDLVMGHSLGRVRRARRCRSLTFEAALEAVSARGREMADLEPEDPGAMAAVTAPLSEVEEVVAEVDGYAVVANVNSTRQVVLGGATDAVERAVELLQERGHQAIRLPVSHAFHTEIVAPAPVRRCAHAAAPRRPPAAAPDRRERRRRVLPDDGDLQEKMLEMLARQVASPVQFVKGLRTLYDAGARIFVECGPKRALAGFASDVLGADKVLSWSANHPKTGDVASFNGALCGLWAAGLGAGVEPATAESAALKPGATAQAVPRPAPAAAGRPPVAEAASELSRLFAEFVERGRALMGAAGRRTSGPPNRW